MEQRATSPVSQSLPAPSAILEVLKPVTWFAPMWAFGCGVVSSGQSLAEHWAVIAAGVLLAGPLVCGTSQVANDWYDRHVDAINEPNRPIPSGRIPGQWGFWIAVVWSALSVAVATTLGTWGFIAAIVALVLAWLYSAPPIRLKRNGWLSCTACALAYEGLPWFTGAAIMTAAFPDPRIVLLALLYSAGAIGIMALNDFKAIEGDREMGIRTLPVIHGPRPAAVISCVLMAVPQAAVVAALLIWDRPYYAAAVTALLAVQLVLMVRLLRDPRRFAPWYNATGTSLYVIGMLVSAFAVNAIVEVT
jgi:chlorophyll synthase